MIFLGLFIYLVVMPIVFVVGYASVRTIPFVFGGSVLFAWIAAYFIAEFAPSWKPRVRNLIRVKGIRSFLLLCLFVVGVLLAFKIFRFGEMPGFLVLAFSIPIAGTFAFNFLGEIPLSRLEDEVEPGRIVLSPAPPPPPAPKEDIRKRFEWQHEEKPYTLDTVLRCSEYDKYKAKPRVTEVKHWPGEYVVNGVTGEVHDLASRLFKIGMPFGTLKEVAFVLSFVQGAVDYKEEEGEYPKYPIETLADGCGDCEDMSILGAAILKCMGYEVALLDMPEHIALGVAGAEGMLGTFVEHEKVRYFYCEMTSTGARFGELPEEVKIEDVKALPVPPLPAKVVLPEGTDGKK